MADRLDDLRRESAESPFRGFQCWSAAEVGEIMHREAAAPSRAVLLATHQPPRIRKVRVTEAGRYGTEDLITQDDLLKTVASATDQALIVPVIGAAGSGKSHLVLWLRARLEDQNDPNRKIIYLPKGETALDRVIELILDGRTGSPFDEIREGVASATRTMGPEERARRLRDELSLAVRKLEPSSGDPSRDDHRQHLSDNLPDLLDDPVYAKRLVGDGGPLRRIVEQVAAGGREEPAEIKSEDLDIQLTALELEELSKPAKTLLGDLQALPALHEAAIDVLNELLPRCLMRLFNVEPMQLVAVMHELRARLLEENPHLELILMIEDFTLLQGIQHDLLEAMIDPPRREGHQVMCAMKTVMAVTDGFFTRVLASSDTLRTRIAAQGHVYNLDVHYGADAETGLDTEAVTDFAGRYLNAVRVGSADIEASAPVVHNACEVCAHRDICHNAFGTSGPEEYGLYPFNAVALDRVVRSRQDKFNPRDLLAVMAMTLTAHLQEIQDGRFPSDSWARNFDASQFDRPSLETLSLRVQQEVDQTLKGEQRRVLLTFWGGVPDKLVNVPAGIHDAFDIPAVTGARPTAPRAPKPVTAAKPRTEDVDQIGDAVRSWRDGARLDADTARVIRRALRDAILAAVDPENELISLQFLREFFDQDTDIAIENSAGSARPAPGRFRAEFAPTNENALLFEGILKMQRHGTWAIQDGAQTLVAFLARVDAEAARLRAFLLDRVEERRKDHDDAVALLALSGLIAGKGSASDARGLLAAAMAAGEPSRSETQPDRWRTLVDMTNQRHGVVREFVLQAAHVSKSTADPSGVDGSRFTDALRGLAANWSLPTVSDSAPRQVQALRQVLDTRLQPALEEAHDVLREWHEDIVRLVGDADSAGERAKQWRATLDAAQADGFLVRARGYTEDGGQPQFGATIRVVQGVLSQWTEMNLGRRLSSIAKVPWARLAPLRDHLSALEATLVASLEKALTQHADVGGESPIASFERALDRLARAAVLNGEAE